MNNFYVYLLLNPLKPKISSFKYKDLEINVEFEPFYIGKGKGRRDTSHLTKSCLEREYEGKNLHKVNTIKEIFDNNIRPIIIRPFENLLEDYAYELEGIFERIIGRSNINSGPLTNLIAGGRGVKMEDWIKIKISNTKQNNPTILSEISKRKISENLIKFWSNEKNRLKISELLKQYWTVNEFSEKQKICQSNFGNNKKKNPEIQKRATENMKKFWEGKERPFKIQIFQYDLEYNLIKIHNGVNEAAKFTNLQRANISKAINNKTKNKIPNYYREFIWSKTEILKAGSP